RAGELLHHPSEQGGELGGEEDQPGRKRRVDALRGIHTLDILRVAHDPVEMAETAKQQAVVKGRVKVDDRELARTIDGEQIDLAARVTRNLGVDRVYKGGNVPTPDPLNRYAAAVTSSPSDTMKPPVS